MIGFFFVMGGGVGPSDAQLRQVAARWRRGMDA
jgi:hypothetical protein